MEDQNALQNEPKTRDLLIRRSLDFLVVILINTGMSNTGSRSNVDYNGLFSAVQEVS